jgi:hypothetical protein
MLNELIEICHQVRPKIKWLEPELQINPTDHTEMKPGEPGYLHIFLCHATRDKPIVRELYNELKVEGFEPWLDENDLLPGQDWQLEITKALKASEVIIVCASRVSINKAGFVQKEVRFALDRAFEQPEGAIFLIPLKLQPCELPESLSRYQWVEYYEDNGYQQLTRALRARAASLGLRPTVDHKYS